MQLDCRNICIGTIKPRDLEFAIPVPRLAGLLTHSFNRIRRLPEHPFSDFLAMLSAYSDEIVQASHLFPYSP